MIERQHLLQKADELNKRGQEVLKRLGLLERWA